MDAVVSAVTSLAEGPGFEGLEVEGPVSSHSPKTCKLWVRLFAHSNLSVGVKFECVWLCIFV